MNFKIQDRVIIKSKDQEEENMKIFQKLQGIPGIITDIYYNDYAPETQRYEVTIKKPIITEDGIELTVISGLYNKNLLMANNPDTISENNHAIASFLVYESMENSSWYYGLADCHGLISFIKEPNESDEWTDVDQLFDIGLIDIDSTDSPEKKEYNKNINMMSMTAQANQQRYTLVYRAKISPEIAKDISLLLKKGNEEDSLNILKNEAIEVQLVKNGGLNLEKAWDKIPNPELDPMY